MGKLASLVAAKGKTFFATALAILALPLATQAANSTWGGSTGNWDVPGNWNNGIPTTAVATVNGGTAIVPTGYTGTATSLYISGSSGASGSVLISGGSMRVNSLMSVGSVAGSTGSLRITDGTLSSGST